MAIFQQRFERKVTLDDTEPINCIIETSQKVNGHTEYVLKLQRGPIKENCWRLYRRYNDFVELHKCLAISGVLLPLPEKKLFGNMHPEFIAKRLSALQEYINIVLMNPILASSLPAKKFVDPETYNQSFLEVAIQNASLCLRTEGLYVLGPSLGAIGWRLRKHYFKVTLKNPNTKNTSEKSSGKHFLVKSSSQSNQKTTNGCPTEAQPPTELTLSWIEYGPDKYVDDKEIHNVFKSLAAIQHPFIQPIECATTNDSGALIVRKFNPKGSVKDLLCGSQAKNPFLNKYGSPSGRTALPVRDVALYGRQILEALRFLHSKGMPFGHVHAGNVIIVDGTARLLDVENFILGVPSFYRPFFMQHSKIFTSEIIDVYSFGHLLFEMSMGYPLQESIARQAIECSGSLKNLLESILSKEACRVGLPTLDQLAAHPFFSEYAPRFAEQYASVISANKPVLKLSSVAKDQLKMAAQRTEQRLQNEQKSTKNQKRLVRVQEMMSSEEDKKKIKHKAKLEHKQSKLRQQNSLQLNTMPTPSPAPILVRSDSIHSLSTIHSTVSSPPPVLQPPIDYPSTSSVSANNTQPTTVTSATTPIAAPVPHHTLTKAKSTTHESCDASTTSSTSTERSTFLDSISSFNKSNLRKVASSDQ